MSNRLLLAEISLANIRIRADFSGSTGSNGMNTTNRKRREDSGVRRRDTMIASRFWPKCCAATLLFTAIAIALTKL